MTIPVNPTMSQDEGIPTTLTDPAESSKAGERRMRSLRAQSNCGRSSQEAAIHPQSTALVYPPIDDITAMTDSVRRSHSISALFSPTTPRPLQTPAILPPGKQLSISPSGDWVIVFHPNPITSTPGGTLAVYPSAILLPPSSGTANNIVPFASFILSSEPIASVHLYPSRTFVSSNHESLDQDDISRAPALGPHPPPTYDPAKTLAMVLLTADSKIHLIHPYPIQLNPMIGLPQMQPNSYGLNCLSCSTTTREFARFSPSSAIGQVVQSVGGDGGGGAKSLKAGFLSLVVGSSYVWAGIDDGDGVGRVVAAYVGQTRDGTYYLRTTPLPSLPRCRPPPLSPLPEASDRKEPTSAEIYVDLQAMCFVPTPKSERVAHSEVKEEKMEEAGQQPSDDPPPQDGVGVALVFRDTSRKGAGGPEVLRTRIEVLTFERRALDLAEGFNEIDSAQNDGSPLYDWIVGPRPIRTVLSPPNLIVSALYPLPVCPPHTLALAVMVLPSNGAVLCQFDLCDDESATGQNVDNDIWSAIKGQRIPLPDRIRLDTDLVVSQSIERGCLGLVGFVGRYGGVDLLIGPSRHLADISLSVEQTAAQAALAIYLAIRQGAGWADVIRAAFHSFAPSSWTSLATALLQKSFAILSAKGQTDLVSLLQVEIAVFRMINDARSSASMEILRLCAASDLFDELSSPPEPNSRVPFDINSLWGLINVLDWTLHTLTEAMRDCVEEWGRLEWDDGMLDPDGAYPRAIYLLHPLIRPRIITILAQVQAFALFVENLATPISISGTGSGMNGRDPRAAEIAKFRVASLLAHYGFDAELWGSALEKVSDDGLSPEQIRDSMLSLSLNDIRQWANTILPTLPSPSSIFLAEEEERTNGVDAVTFAPQLPSKVHSHLKATNSRGLVTCDRCGSKTSRARLLADATGTGPLEAWRARFTLGCLCGGTWII